MDFQPLIQVLGIDKLPEDKQQAILGQAFATLQKRLSLRLAYELTDEQAKQLELVANGDGDALEELEKIYPDFKQVYQEEIDDLKDDLQAILPI